MKKLGLVAALFVFAAVLATAENLFKNGDFSKGQDPWISWNDDGAASMKAEDGQMVIESSRWGAKSWSSQAMQKGISLENGATYKLSFDAYSTMEREMVWVIQQDGGSYTAYAGGDNAPRVKLGTSKQHYEFTFKMDKKSDPKASFCLNVGKPSKDAGKSVKHTLYFDNFVLEKVN